MDVLLMIQNMRNNPHKSIRETWVICDRHLDSSWAYQSAEAVPQEQISAVQSIYTLTHPSLSLPRPDLTIYLDLPIELARKRILERSGADSLSLI